mmetsp:Transcript_43385/g.114748  ORF Transcript_43385/g.114748 Transcript_43385/m.114748 type:complete len:303 (+) Transcript_43385:45-953(+)
MHVVRVPAVEQRRRRLARALQHQGARGYPLPWDRLWLLPRVLPVDGQAAAAPHHARRLVAAREVRRQAAVLGVHLPREDPRQGGGQLLLLRVVAASLVVEHLQLREGLGPRKDLLLPELGRPHHAVLVPDGALPRPLLAVGLQHEIHGRGLLPRLARRLVEPRLLLHWQSVLLEDGVLGQPQPAGELRQGDLLFGVLVQQVPILHELGLRGHVPEEIAVDLAELRLVDHLVVVEVEEREDEQRGVLGEALVAQDAEQSFELWVGEAAIAIEVCLPDAVVEHLVHVLFRASVRHRGGDRRLGR